MANYAYDIECFDSVFLVIAINANSIFDSLIEEYEKYDIEKDILAKEYVLSLLDIKVFRIDNKVNESLELAKWLIQDKPVLFGYNNKEYDDRLLKLIIRYNGTSQLTSYNNDITPMKFLRNNSDDIINSQRGYLSRYTLEVFTLTDNIKLPNITIDLKTLNYLNNVSLKHVAILLKHYRIQDLPYRNILEFDYTPDMENLITEYCINDVLITRKLLKFSKPELEVRIATTNKYKLNVLSDSRSSMANKLLALYYRNIANRNPNFKQQTISSYIKLGELIEPIIEFKTDKFKEVYNTIKAKTFLVGKDTFNPSLLISDNLKLNLGVGGIHSEDRGISIIIDDTFDLTDVDVNSFYPSSIVNYLIHPRHIPAKYFIPLIKNILGERLEAKSKAKDYTLLEKIRIDFKHTADILKIVINIIYGKLGDKFSWLLDHRAMYKTTINCQLGLMMLIEDLLLAEFKIISVNTDGVVTIVPVDRREEYTNICENWSKKLNYGVEYTQYREYYAIDVNNYLAIKTNGEIKTKGIFTNEPEKQDKYLNKGYDKPIIGIAIYEYLVNKVPVEDTIYNHWKKHERNILDYTMSQKTGEGYIPHEIKYNKVTNNIDYVKLQKTIRFYVSKGGSNNIVKIKGNKTISLLKGYSYTIFNDFVKKDDYDINYSYYLKEVTDIIYNINNVHVSKIMKAKKGKRISGTLFD